MNHNGEHLVAKAQPSKAFFIDMLTRDIGLSVCILDLIDNSIDSLIAASDLDVSQHLIAGTKAQSIRASIEISFTPSRFTITDNCGGISISKAEERIFLLGNPADETSGTRLGVYGIGMKRAFFKIGKKISFMSHTREEELKIDIDVDSWKTEEEWRFPFTYGRPKKSTSGGTTIEITDLHEVIGQQFASKAFRTLLTEKISRAYALFLKAGAKIKVNGEEHRPEFPELAESSRLRAVRQLVKADGVDVLVMAGLSPSGDRTPRGWYVFCNGRMVLDGDKTSRTGWNVDSHPTFHSKYNHFLGYVYFSSKDGQKLPWTTTKDDVDQESPIYQRALAEMWILSRRILDFLNDLYPEVKEEAEAEHDLFESAKPVSPQTIARRPNAKFQATVKKQPGNAPVWISYQRPKAHLESIKEALGRPRMSAARIGQYTFDWFYDKNCK